MQPWQAFFDERQLKEIEFCKIYAEQFRHGTDGHNIRLIVAKLVEILEEHTAPTELEHDPAKPEEL